MKVVASLAMLVVLAAGSPALADVDECNPYPLGYCGTYPRETVWFCYYVVDGRFVDATDPATVRVDVPASGITGLRLQLYLRNSTLDLSSGAPSRVETLYVERNGFPGLQPGPGPFHCSLFIWYPEIDDGMWMWWQSVRMDPDPQVHEYALATGSALAAGPLGRAQQYANEVPGVVQEAAEDGEAAAVEAVARANAEAETFVADPAASAAARASEALASAGRAAASACAIARSWLVPADRVHDLPGVVACVP